MMNDADERAVIGHESYTPANTRRHRKNTRRHLMNSTNENSNENENPAAKQTLLLNP